MRDAFFRGRGTIKRDEHRLGDTHRIDRKRTPKRLNQVEHQSKQRTTTDRHFRNTNNNYRNISFSNQHESTGKLATKAMI